jgi:two-component system sensor histidine kinase ResE
MPTKGTDEAMVRRDRPVPERLIELAVLAALGAGAAEQEVTTALQDGGGSLDREDVRRLGECLAGQGLLQRVDRDGPDYALTPAGRRATLALAGESVAVAADHEARIERLRTDLLSTVSHELRTPLTLIRTSIGLLLDSQPDEEMRLRLLHNIKQSTDRMSALVTDLLDLVRLRHERAELPMRRIDVGVLVTDVATMMRPLIEDRQQTLEVPPLRPWPRLQGDPRRLERLVLNLVSNASKFSPPGARIRIEVVAAREEVTIGVADTGPGIPPEVLPHLFEQFYTARTSSSSHNIGVGLGLPIAKSIAEAHGGRIDVESEVGVGSTFRVTLPRHGRRREGPE